MDSIIPDVFKEFQEIGGENMIGSYENIDWEQKMETRMLTPEIHNDFQEFEGTEVVVFGDPMRTGEQLDHLQGDNPYRAKGNCGLVSAANFLNMCGISAADEKMITKYALENNLCSNSWFISQADRGGVTQEELRTILGDFGIETQVYGALENGGTIESIASRLEAGHVGTMGVNAGHLWNDPAYIGDGCANHEVTLTGTIRDLETGELLGLTICDSGDGKACDVLTIEELKACYEDAAGAHVIFSNAPVRQQI